MRRIPLAPEAPANRGSVLRYAARFRTPVYLLRSGQDPVSLRLRTVMGGSSAGSRADFDDLELIVEGVASGSEGWEAHR